MGPIKDFKNRLKNFTAHPEEILEQGEAIVWKGKPKKNAFILNKTIGVLPIVLLFVGFGLMFLFLGVLLPTNYNPTIFDLLPLVLVSIFVIFIFVMWLIQCFSSYRMYSLTEYMITNKRVIVKDINVSGDFICFDLDKIVDLAIHVGLIDRLTGVGDVYITYNGYSNSNGMARGIMDIEDPYNIYKLILKASGKDTTDKYQSSEQNNIGYRK